MPKMNIGMVMRVLMSRKVTSCPVVISPSAGKVPTGGDQEAEGDASNGVNHRDEAVAVLACAHGLVSIGTGFSG